MEIVNPHKKYNSSEHIVFSCQYHVIFCPKYRRGIFKDGLDKRLKEIFIEVADKYEFKIIEMEILPDHIHMIIDCNPRFGIMECVRKLKGTSASILTKEYPEIRTKLPSIWTRSAFISSVGSVSLDVVKKYIEEQKGA